MQLSNDIISLGPFSEKHITEEYLSWLKDPEVTKYSEQRHREHTLNTCQSFFDNLSKDDYFFAITANDNVKHIGNCHLKVNKANKTADISILIGNKSFWGKGVATSVYDLISKFSFEHLQLRKITAGTMQINIGMIRVLEKNGFVADGIKKKQFLWQNKEVDAVFFAKFKG